MRSISVAERENLFTFNKASTIFLFFKGLVMLADSFKLVVPLWFAVVSMTMTIAVLGLNLGPSIAAKDVVRNVISGVKLLMLQQRFEVGNMIRVDDVDGQVVSSGLATTCILMADTAPITVPNSVLLELLYLNRVGIFSFTSRHCFSGIPAFIMWTVTICMSPHYVTASPFVAQDGVKYANAMVTRQHPLIDRWDAMVTNIPLRTFDINTIDLTSVEIERMLESSPKSQTEFKSTKKEFLIQSIEIITQHGATLACTLEDVLNL
ncbi:hypothetical protein Vadar_026445 [Vaccinium darrowii]|uniref:Uncharacterized protein n=1 Tax=Vaccinium darrowii TaxID=229202 RepID=A0ACB7Y1Z4_9ERIC|nr:hypothetical protein Vadar_026445 [Vaccinium darrowii]